MTDPAPGDRAPAGARSYRVEARASAPPEAVWPLLGEAERWREWTFVTRSDRVRDGHPDPDGVGAVRRFTRFGVGSREEVLAFEPPHHLAYRILSGFPVRNYRADVTLEEDGGGTRITWTGTYDERWPGTAGVLGVVLGRMMQRFATDLAGHADAGHRPG